MSSGGRVTITLGGSGQTCDLVLHEIASDHRLSRLAHLLDSFSRVMLSLYMVVKRARPPSGIGLETSGSKQDLRERLEGNTSQYKRRRTENVSSSLNDNSVKYSDINHQVGHTDLRLKLIKKQRRQGTEGQRNADLREKLSRKRQVSSRSNSRQHIRNSGLQGSLRVGVSNPVHLLPPRRSADDLLHLDSLRRSYSSRFLDGRRHTSPDKLIGVSRALSPSGIYEDMDHARTVRSINGSRNQSLITNGVIDPLRSYSSRIPVRADVAKPVAKVPPPTSVGSRSLHQPETPVTVASLLNSLGLEKYKINFQAEEVDMAVLKQMGEIDLKDLGLPMGPRKKILLALSCLKHQHR